MESRKLKVVVLLSIFHFPFSIFHSYAQHQNFPLHRDAAAPFETQLHAVPCSLHTSIKPYLQSELIHAAENDSSFANAKVRELKKKEKNSIELSPLAGLQTGYDTYRGELLTELGGGLRLNGDFKKLSCNVNAYWATESFTGPVDSLIRLTGVVPGFGRAYAAGKAWSYENYTGYLSYSPNKIFNFQAGRDKHFWGEGYRSLFLSDAANSYPYFKISANVWKLKYVSMVVALKDVTAPSGMKKDFSNKYGTFHYLSWNATKRLNLSVFESIIWQGTDTNRTRGPEINYFNPVIFFRPVEYSLGSGDNALLGMGFKIKIARKQQLYGQVILDEFLLKEVRSGSGWWANKQGFQLGFRSFDLFRIKGLSYQGEFNYVRPFTYSHGSVAQNYGHYNQALAHPAGANFIENLHILQYRRGPWMAELKSVYILTGKDELTTNWGGNIFESYTTRTLEYGNTTTQGLKTGIFTGDLRLSYRMIFGQSFAGITIREMESIYGKQRSNFFYLGIRTAIWNRYTDY